MEYKYTQNDLKAMQEWTLEHKIQVSQTRVLEWINHFDNKVYVSFSGGKDSTVLADLVARVCNSLDLPLVLAFCDTGLEYPEIRQFVKDFHIWLQETYDKTKILLRQYFV